MRVLLLLLAVAACSSPKPKEGAAARWEIEKEENLAVPVCPQCEAPVLRTEAKCAKCGAQCHVGEKTIDCPECRGAGKVEFDPKEIDAVDPQQTQKINVRITPSQQAIAGDYMVTVRASGSGASESRDFRVTVTTSTLWGIVGIGVVAAAVVVLGAAVTRYGRR